MVSDSRNAGLFNERLKSKNQPLAPYRRKERFMSESKQLTGEQIKEIQEGILALAKESLELREGYSLKELREQIHFLGQDER